MMNKEKIKILFVVDMHGSKSAFDRVLEKARNVDIVIDAGDFTFFSENIKPILKRYNSIKKQILITHGNHENREEVDFLCKKCKNLTFLHKKIYEYKNLIFYFYGGGGFAIKEIELEDYIPKIKKRFSAFKKKHKNARTIIIFHGPPYKTNLDMMPFGHVGSKSKTKLIKAIKPNVVIAGHIHECEYKKELIGKTFLLNPGPRGRIITFNKD